MAPGSRLSVLDTFSGQSLGHKDFNNDGTGLLNLVLSPDGKLVYLTADQLACKDLFDTGDLSKPTFAVSTRRADGNPLFMGSIQPEQLAIADGRVLVLSDNGQFVRVYSLETGKPLQPVNAKGNRADVDGGLQTQSSEWRAQLLTVGSARTSGVQRPSSATTSRTSPTPGLGRLSKLKLEPPRRASGEGLPGDDRRAGQPQPPTADQRRPAPGSPNPPRIKFTAFSRSITDSGRRAACWHTNWI